MFQESVAIFKDKQSSMIYIYIYRRISAFHLLRGVPAVEAIRKKVWLVGFTNAELNEACDWLLVYILHFSY